MRLAFAEMMKKMDGDAINKMGVPSTWLMTNAADHAALAAEEFMSHGGCAAVFCGSGNNGGDGVAAALRLILRGYRVRVFLVGSRDKMTDDTREMERRLMEVGGVIEEFSAECIEFCEKAEVFIDAMFGTGLRSGLRGKALEAAGIMNSCAAPVVAADIASGVSADTGEVMSEAVRADVTVTFSCAKPGHFLGRGALHSGEVRVRDIGIPESILNGFETDIHAVTADDMRLALPKRAVDAHKGNFGKILIVAGCRGFTGAPSLAAKAALRAGAGLVSLGVPEAIYELEAVKNDEAMPFPLPCDGDGRLSLRAFDDIIYRLKNCDECLIGPGLGRSSQVTELVCRLIESSPVPLVIDADGINAVSENIDVLKRAKADIILTPHEGEFRRLSSALDETDRLSAARFFAREHNVTLVLKGHGTVTAYPDGRAYINTTGGPALAKGGTGDVLAGMICAFAAQGIAPEKAVYLHGRAADIYAGRFGEYSMLASDVIGLLPEAIFETFKN